MKKLVLLGLMCANLAMAQGKTSVISKRQVVLPVEISSNTVILSNLGYGAFMVKILIPSIADVTLFDHRNEGASAPCIFTLDTEKIEDVIRNNPTTENIPFVITLTKTVAVDSEDSMKPTCRVTLTESLEGKIRGFKFTHARQSQVSKRSVEDCR